jgi:hypothetical protein
LPGRGHRPGPRCRDSATPAATHRDHTDAHAALASAAARQPAEPASDVLTRPSHPRNAVTEEPSMSATAVRIENGYHLIDTAAWVRQRTDEPLRELTDNLAEFTRHPVFADCYPPLGTIAQMQLWCAARGWTAGDESSHYHGTCCLTEPVTFVLALDADRVTYALVQIGTDTPEVFRDVTADDAYWHQVESVDIVCPGGHRWTWLDHAHLLDHTGTDVALSDLFGHEPGAPYADCRDCLAYDDGDRDDPCPCDNRNTIYCPTCTQRCQLELTDVPTYSVPAQQ